MVFRQKSKNIISYLLFGEDIIFIKFPTVYKYHIVNTYTMQRDRDAVIVFRENSIQNSYINSQYSTTTLQHNDMT